MQSSSPQVPAPLDLGQFVDLLITAQSEASRPNTSATTERSPIPPAGHPAATRGNPAPQPAAAGIETRVQFFTLPRGIYALSAPGLPSLSSELHHGDLPMVEIALSPHQGKNPATLIPSSAASPAQLLHAEDILITKVQADAASLCVMHYYSRTLPNSVEIHIDRLG